MILLAVDIGNSNLKIGRFEADRLTHSWRVATPAREQSEDEVAVLAADLLGLEGGSLREIGGLAIASVVPAHTDAWIAFGRRRLGVEPMVADAASLAALIEIGVPHPAEVGADRLVNALAVASEFGAPAIVVDVGTATTFDAVDGSGAFVGGAIAAGPLAALEALSLATARLPRVELRRPPNPIGRNTVEAMQSGAVNGYIGLVSGLLTAIRAELLERSPGPGRVTVVVTGGHVAEPWLRDIPGIDAFEPELTLRGLRLAFGRLRESTAGDAARASGR